MKGRSITQAQAWKWFKCWRLAPRIQELKEDLKGQGVIIITTMIYKKDGTRYGKYTLSA